MARASDSSADAIQARVRGAGLRCTAARVAVLQHLESSAGPRTHAEVSEALADRGYDRATIYRNLTELTEARLVARVELGDHMWRFEAKRPAHGNGEDHPHFVCTSCGEVSCLDDVTVAITPRARPATGRTALGKGPRGIRSVTDVVLKGQCDHCG
jgi:Fur family ferric uptake transcriptional regulator